MTVEPQAGPRFRSQATWMFSVSDVQTDRVGAKERLDADR
jgi:hypothetical protein